VVNQNLHFIYPSTKDVFPAINTFPPDSFLILKNPVDFFCIVQILRLNSIGRMDVIGYLVTHCTLDCLKDDDSDFSIELLFIIVWGEIPP
jgi:hypothetical protein